MVASLKFLFRIFFWTSFTWGGWVALCLSVLALLSGGSSSHLFTIIQYALVGGVVFGSAMALALGVPHVLIVWLRSYPLTDETLAVCQRRRLALDLPFGEAFTLCLHSVRHVGNADVEEETDYSGGVILARTRWSWTREWGKRIRFELRECGGGTQVVIECYSGWKTVLVDFGFSLQVVDAIVGFLLAEGTAAAKQRIDHEHRVTSIQQGRQEGYGITRVAGSIQPASTDAHQLE